MRRLSLNNQSGMSLISLIIGLGISGIAITALTRYSDHSLKAATSAQLLSEKIQLRHIITQEIDCQNTLNPSGAPYDKLPPLCKNLKITSLKNKKGNQIFKSEKLGRFIFALSCDPDNGLTVKSALVKKSYTTKAKKIEFLKDPLNNKEWDFSYEKSMLFPQELGLCGEMFGSSASQQYNPGALEYSNVTNKGSYYDVYCNGDKYITGVKFDNKIKGDDHVEGIYCR
ncbi:MAG: hypothetical protein R3B45_04510 [Bdellovibrionota bacterium]